jgi:hypothetical protein
MTLTAAILLGYVLGLATALLLGACILLVRGGHEARDAEHVRTKGRGW